MRLLFAVILGMMSLTCLGQAQEDNVTTAASALQGVVSALKQSAEKMSLDNNQLLSQDNTIKHQVLQLQTQLRRLKAKGDALKKAADKLRNKNPRRILQIARLEKENSDLDAAIFPPNGLGADPRFVDPWDDAHLRQLESELKVLENDYVQLKDLAAKMSERIKSASLTASQHAEEEKLQNSLDNLKSQSTGLMADLDELRCQMIALDKRKSYLEMMLQK